VRNKNGERFPFTKIKNESMVDGVPFIIKKAWGYENSRHFPFIIKKKKMDIWSFKVEEGFIPLIKREAR